MTYYPRSPEFASHWRDSADRACRTVHISEPTATLVRRAIAVQVSRLRNPALTPGERAEAAECLKTLLHQYHEATGRHWQREAAA